MTSSKHVLTIGFHPDVPGPLKAGELLERLRDTAAVLETHGFEMDSCFVTNTDKDEAIVEAAVRAKQYACVCIGAGLRLAPQHTALFEKIVDTVRRCAPQTRLCFNAALTDVVAAVLRATAK